jgi:ribokinase
VTRLPEYVDVLVVNAIEAAMLGADAVLSLETAAAAAETLASRFKAVVVTAGGDGVAFAGRSGERVAPPGIPVKVASTHGAGDSFVGALAARLAMGDAFDAALTCANQEAARLVATPESERT